MVGIVDFTFYYRGTRNSSDRIRESFRDIQSQIELLAY